MPASGPATDRFLAVLATTHVNGGGLLARFQVRDDDQVSHWFCSRNRFEEYGFFFHLLSSSAVHEAVPQLFPKGAPKKIPRLREHWAGQYALDGELAAILMNGGAYKRFEGPAAEAKALGMAIADELLGTRYDEFHCFTTDKAWSKWFGGAGSDVTWALIDLRAKQVTLICVTDED